MAVAVPKYMDNGPAMLVIKSARLRIECVHILTDSVVYFQITAHTFLPTAALFPVSSLNK